jgi:hypothetical protein
MKIQKVLFSSSDEYLDFWEPISRIFYEKLGIESVLVYFGELFASEKYGKVIRVKPLSYPRRIQLLWSRIWWTKTEPNTTWMLGDIDLFPLQKTRFIDDISDISDDYHVHLGYNKISNPPDLWMEKGSRDGGADLVSHYHVAKGHVFDKNFDLHDSFEEACKFIYESKQYGLGFFCEAFRNEEMMYHCCCEHLTTEKIRNKLKSKSISFDGIWYDYSQCLSRGCKMNYDEYLLKNNYYIDFHSLRPYTPNKETINKILDLAWDGK